MSRNTRSKLDMSYTARNLAQCHVFALLVPCFFTSLQQVVKWLTTKLFWVVRQNDLGFEHYMILKLLLIKFMYNSPAGIFRGWEVAGSECMAGDILHQYIVDISVT
jgi:hypothetical protein